MIFVSGVHGVGKSYFCLEVKKQLGLNSYSASRLISKYKKENFTKDKRVADIDDNQHYLLVAKAHLDQIEGQYLLDGHFCLLDTNGKVQRIKFGVFRDLKPEGIVLLTENPSIIAKRRKQRDNIECDKYEIELFQREEIKYANEVAERLLTPIFLSKGADYISDALQFIQKIVKGV